MIQVWYKVLNINNFPRSILENGFSTLLKFPKIFNVCSQKQITNSTYRPTTNLKQIEIVCCIYRVSKIKYAWLYTRNFLINMRQQYTWRCIHSFSCNKMELPSYYYYV